VGDAPFNWTVPVAFAPPVTEAGVTEIPVRTGGVTDRFEMTERPSAEAVIAAVAVDFTVMVEIEKVPTVWPAVTSIVPDETTAIDEFEDMFTINPPAGAMALRVTVPEHNCPPTTGDGFKDSDIGPTGITVSVCRRVTPE